MKALQATLPQIVKTARKGDCVFRDDTLEAIRKTLATVVTEQDLSLINLELSHLKARQLNLDDIARIAFVHMLSIRQNDGYSPYERITKFCAKNNHHYNKLHIKIVTDILLAVEFLKLEAGENRQAKDRQCRCRRYSIPQDVIEQLTTTRT